MQGRGGRAAAGGVVLLAGCLAAVPLVRAADTTHAGPTPILLELFTSEGCSSCPPVDVWAERMDHIQPVPGAEIIVLSEHVNYWDHDGWKDPFSSAQLTERQRDYEQMIGTEGMYTPQVILNGAEVVNVAGSGEKIKETFEKAAALATVPVHLSGVTLAAGDPGSVITGKVAVDATGEKHGGDVYVAVALNRTQTDVLAGENDGKKLTNVAVVKDLVKVGKLEKGKSFEDPFTIKLWPGADPANLRVVAFVQESNLGHVLGAAMIEAMGGTQRASATH